MVLRPFVEEPKGEVANYPYFERGKDSTMAYLYRLFQERIVMFDGAMGTMIQKHKLGEEEYRGERFKASAACRCSRLQHLLGRSKGVSGAGLCVCTCWIVAKQHTFTAAAAAEAAVFFF